jgi:3-phenylpropionate/cinnamic acid dioxygenase small subunit
MSQERLAIQDLLLNYAAAVDEGDRERYGACFTDDVEIIGFGSGPVTGRDTWLDYVFATLDKFQSSQHLLGTPLTTVDGDRASARTDFQAVHRFREGQDATRFILWGTYLTDMCRIEGNWKICRHQLVVRDTHTE